MSDRDLMQQALEALEYYNSSEDYFPTPASKLIPNLRARLAQPEPVAYDQTSLELCEICGWKTLIPDDGCLNCKRWKKPEPIAWISKESLYRLSKGGNSNGTVPVHVKQSIASNTPLYTAPPQREWQGLTDEEIQQMSKGGTFYDFARAVEAKLKDKNNG